MALQVKCKKGHSYIQPDIVDLPEGVPICPECREEWNMSQQAEIPTILEDDREIYAIWLNDQNGWAVGRVAPAISSDTCTRIIAYEELGQMACVPWFAVYDEDVLIVRVPAHQCQEVKYKV